MSQCGKMRGALSPPSGEKVYYRYYAIMGTRVHVVAGYRAFSAFILLRRGKATGALFSYFFLFSPFCSFSFVVCWFFFEKIPRAAQISRQSRTYRGKKFRTFGNGRLAKCAATKYVGLTCVMAKYLRMSNGRCVYARALEANEKKDFKNT